jgi:hypothetical protein
MTAAPQQLPLLLLLLMVQFTSSFYLPGVAPTDYSKGEEMRVKVRSMNVVTLQIVVV